jgi:hypothetical protein
MIKYIGLAAAGILLLAAGACEPAATVASRNISQAADNFEVPRKVSFVNGITGDELFFIEGFCSIEDQTTQLEVTCKLDEGQFVKHFLGLSDNMTYAAIQLETVDVSTFHHRVYFRPQAVIPDIDFQGSVGELIGQ